MPNSLRLHLRSPAPPAVAPQEYPQPFIGEAIKRNMGLPPRLPEGSPLPPPPLEAEPVPFRLVINWAALALYMVGFGSAIVVGWLALGAWQVWRLRRMAEPSPERFQILLRELTPARMPVPTLGVLDKLPVAVAVGLSNPVRKSTVG